MATSAAALLSAVRAAPRIERSNHDPADLPLVKLRTCDRHGKLVTF